jgi:hypothetical protein
VLFVGGSHDGMQYAIAEDLPFVRAPLNEPNFLKWNAVLLYSRQVDIEIYTRYQYGSIVVYGLDGLGKRAVGRLLVLRYQPKPLLPVASKTLTEPEVFAAPIGPGFPIRVGCYRTREGKVAKVRRVDPEVAVLVTHIWVDDSGHHYTRDGQWSVGNRTSRLDLVEYVGEPNDQVIEA